MEVKIVLTFLFIIAWFALVSLGALQGQVKSRWLCDHLDWHAAPEGQGFDGISFHGTCSRCGRKILQDSNGDWFGIHGG